MLSSFAVSADSTQPEVVSASPEKLARDNMPLATFLAVEKARSATHVDLDDLLSAARLGLARAAMSYDPARGIPFGAFASSQINWAMLSEMRRADPAGERSRDKIERLRVAAETLLARTGRVATTAELARESGFTVDVVAEMMKLDEMVRTATSFEEHFDVETGRQAADLTDSVILPEHAVEQSETRAMVNRVIEALPAAMRQVVRGIYLEDRMVKDIAEELEVSHAYVSKVRSRGLALMREAMEAWENGTTGDRSTKARAEFFETLFGPIRPEARDRSSELLAAV
ncbi:RNA polymerase sigma factor for flagellar operon FliA [Microbacterium foliorum]|uniref:RNA polymerase sigma factor for flagellar operon FliA n=1 Tax=Microbacterium foliorum TaxID=104336 RepID=A0ABU1HRN0_9MICO|nr:sigma-70 family RNA polymerase sigma factor [Microbacterium foliorum]MDR6141735.1 RNA polymerase sigma factor for flagellar operon FliA [Microbacterium foliorum]